MEGAKKAKPQEFVSHAYNTRNKAEEKRQGKKQRTATDAPNSRGVDVSEKPLSDTAWVKKAKLVAPEVPGGSSARQTGLAVGEEGKVAEQMETREVTTTPLGSPIVPPAGHESGKTSVKDPGNVLSASPGGQPVANPNLPFVNVRDGESVRQFVYAVRPAVIAEQLESKTDKTLFMDALKESLSALMNLHKLGERMERQDRIRQRAMELQSKTATERRTAEAYFYQMEARAVAAEKMACEGHKAEMAMKKRAEEAELQVEDLQKWVRKLSAEGRGTKSGSTFQVVQPSQKGTEMDEGASVLKRAEDYLQKKADEAHIRETTWQRGFERGKLEGLKAGRELGEQRLQEQINALKTAHATELQEKIGALETKYKADLEEEVSNAGHDFAAQALALQNFGFKEGWCRALRMAGKEEGDDLFKLYIDLLPNADFPAVPPE